MKRFIRATIANASVLSRELSRKGRHPNVLAVGICDVDRFKQIRRPPPILPPLTRDLL